MPNYEKFMISQVAVWVKDGKVLILENAGTPDKWVLPGGRIDEQEDPEVAFARELKEEIGMEQFEKGELLHMHVWYVERKNRLPYSAVAYKIESDQEEVPLSFEHTSYKWITKDEIDNYEYLWDCAPTMLKKGFE